MGATPDRELNRFGGLTGASGGNTIQAAEREQMGAR
jgi:hypothetical protein